MSDNESVDLNDDAGVDRSDEESDGEESLFENSGGEELEDVESEDSSDEESVMPDISLNFGDSDEKNKEDQNEDDKDSDEEDDSDGGEQQYSEEESEDDDEDDDEYFKKFDSELRKQHLTNFHPESFSNNYDEISKLTRVVRDDDDIIMDPLHRTAPFLTKYEYTKILGVRAKQLDAGATPFVKVPENMIDSYLIAKLELAEKRIPFIIRRPIANGSSEYWNLKDLEILVN